VRVELAVKVTQRKYFFLKLLVTEKQNFIRKANKTVPSAPPILFRMFVLFKLNKIVVPLCHI